MVIKRNDKPLGSNFIPPRYLPPDKDEWYLRNRQLGESGTLQSGSFRPLGAREIEILVRNRNKADNWNKLLVSEGFNPERVEGCSFHGLVRIGALETGSLEYHDLILPIGIRNCRIISCDIGNNTALENVAYLANYIIRDQVILLNINEMVTTNHAKFGNGIIKEGEDPSVLVELEVGNENGGRAIRPFDGMLAGDAWLWSRFREERKLMTVFETFTAHCCDPRRGYYGTVDSGSIIKNSRILKDVKVGSGAYIKGANKLKNLTISSSTDCPTQIGEGVELVNGIIGRGCRIFYGVKAVRFILGDHSNLKYGARLINSFLGENSTISCCEVLNALIAPGHEQHHNNSFLCAATLLGQTNIAAGATIGSNHNSRGPDGEILAGRGFWPALSTSLKHNSRFASYTLLAKGAYPAELNIPLPFCLISNNESAGRLEILPAYWFRYNMYALARNAWKYGARDKREDPDQQIEFHYLAPDTVEEMFTALTLLEIWTAYDNNIITADDTIMDALLQWTYALEKPEFLPEELRELQAAGRNLLMARSSDTGQGELQKLQALENRGLHAYGLEKSRRDTIIRRPVSSHQIYRSMINLYCIETMARYADETGTSFREALGKLVVAVFPPASAAGATTGEGEKRPLPREVWYNMGGQLISKEEMQSLRDKLLTGEIGSWEELHRQYRTLESNSTRSRALYALRAFCRLHEGGSPTLRLDPGSNTPLLLWDETMERALADARKLKEEITRKTAESREKDYLNGFRTMVYASREEMEAVIGSAGENSFLDIVKEEETSFEAMLKRVGL